MFTQFVLFVMFMFMFCSHIMLFGCLFDDLKAYPTLLRSAIFGSLETPHTVGFTNPTGNFGCHFDDLKVSSIPVRSALRGALEPPPLFLFWL